MRLRLTITTMLTAAALASFAGAAWAAPADFDSSFGQGGVAVVDTAIDASASAVAAQHDGSVVVAGQTADDVIVSRLSANGLLDRTFDDDGVRIIDLGGFEVAKAVAVQPDGKVLVAGFTTLGENGFVHRSNRDGSDDDGFGVKGTRIIDGGEDESISAMAVQRDGKIVLAGSTFRLNAESDGTVYRLTHMGLFDPTFNQVGSRRLDKGVFDLIDAVALLPDDDIVLAGFSSGVDGGVVYRLEPNGAFNESFGVNGARPVDGGGVWQMAAQADGKIVVAGSPSLADDDPPVLHRLEGDGAHDPDFDGDGKLPFAEPVLAVVAQPNGKILLAGDRDVHRLKPDGSHDTSFDADGKLRIGVAGAVRANAMALQADGKIVLASDNSRDILAIRLLGDSVTAAPPSDGGTPPPGGNIPPPEAGPAIVPLADTRAPTISRLALTPRRFRAGRSARIRFTVSEPATVRVTIQRCPRRRRCTITRNLPAGPNAIRFTTRGLRRGRYRLTLTATDRAGNRSVTAPTAFTLRGRPR